jgi:hypothetical protein
MRPRALLLRDAVEEGSGGVHLQRGPGVAGEKGVAPELFGAHHALEQCQVTLALQAQGERGGLEADDLADKRFLHGPAI